jgi:uncharacterized protein (TIGR03382 family)
VSTVVADGGYDLFLAQLRSDGKTLGFSTYLGGAGGENCYVSSVVVDRAGNAYVVGSSSSTDFLIAGALQPQIDGGPGDGIIVKISGLFDAGAMAVPDAGPVDAGAPDAGPGDAGAADAGLDAGVDAGIDAGTAEPLQPRALEVDCGCGAGAQLPLLGLAVLMLARRRRWSQ